MNGEETFPILTVTDAPDSKAEEVIEEGLAQFNENQAGRLPGSAHAGRASFRSRQQSGGWWTIGSDITRPAVYRSVLPPGVPCVSTVSAAALCKRPKTRLGGGAAARRW